MGDGRRLERPAESEYDAYYGAYVKLVPDGDVVDRLARQIDETRAMLEPLDDHKAEHRYAPGKWSIKDIIGHLADTERIFAVRALHFARRDPAALPGMEQDDYVTAAACERRSVVSLLAELVAVRNASVALFRGFDESVWSNRGRASGVEFTVRSFPFIIAGHELHHRRVLEERYL